MHQQLSLSFEPGLSVRFRSVRDAMAAGVYQRGLTTTAGKIDMAPSKLSEKLAGGTGDRERDIGLIEFERYLSETGDRTPILYLIDKFMRDPGVVQQEANARLMELFELILPAAEAAGLIPSRASKKARR